MATDKVLESFDQLAIVADRNLKKSGQKSITMGFESQDGSLRSKIEVTFVTHDLVAPVAPKKGVIDDPTA